ncbi:hypothetical protein H1S01_18370 [Heliobacterium chlorum]|uniref:Uncharacterized protein n=1 Tax=Heliobacterium chlorum TaxID=2698 RepID=A0ABR7T6M8_HELCL|nr:hypothetical protein [Heliobacterium chlorum]MBC9786424.1 hypothetical protein [Heliobacterium chlorum]
MEQPFFQIWGLISYYKNDLSRRKLIFNKIKAFTLRLSTGLLVFVLCLLLTCYSLSKTLYFASFMFTAFGLIIYAISLIGLKESITTVLYEEYGILPNTSVREKVIIPLIKDYLKKRKMLNPEKLKLIIEKLHKEAELEKQSAFVIPGFTLGLIIPIWTQFLVWGFKYIDDFSYATKFSALFFSIVCLITSVYIFFIKPFVDEFWNQDTNKIVELSRIVEDIHFNLRPRKSRDYRSR